MRHFRSAGMQPALTSWDSGTCRKPALPDVPQPAPQPPDRGNPGSFGAKPAGERRAGSGPSTAAGAAATFSPQPAATESDLKSAGQESADPSFYDTCAMAGLWT